MSHKLFYDEYPFDWVDKYSPEELRAVISPLLLRVIEGLPREALVLDVGCGAGRVMAHLGFRNLNCIGLDISPVSVRIMKDRCHLPGVIADNLCLPIKDGHADLVISDGVLHHTGDASRSFAENSRVLRTGGQMYLAVYKPTGRYALLYRYPGWLIRWAVRRSIGKFAVHIFLLPFYYLLHLLKSGGKRTWSGARNLFYDYFVSPRVDFVSRDTIERWSRDRGMRIVSFSSSSKENVHSFLLQKPR